MDGQDDWSFDAVLLAKRAEGPCLFVAERMEELRDRLAEEGLDDQFHPSYTRMVPAHHLMRVELVGCPDPNPVYQRFFEPARNTLPNDIPSIGQRYIGKLSEAIDRWLDRIPKQAPIGVLFSGGIDSGAVFLTVYDRLLKRGESPSRLKAFTLQVDDRAEDSQQATQFLRALGLEMFLEIIEVPSSRLDWQETIRVIEDYKPLDVQSGTMALALCRGIRERYPDWKYLIDGDGGDENLKDYPIEENPELTIRSVLNNLMLYQEGWGVHAIKHSWFTVADKVEDMSAPVPRRPSSGLKVSVHFRSLVSSMWPRASRLSKSPIGIMKSFMH